MELTDHKIRPKLKLNIKASTSVTSYPACQTAMPVKGTILERPPKSWLLGADRKHTDFCKIYRLLIPL